MAKPASAKMLLLLLAFIGLGVVAGAFLLLGESDPDLNQAENNRAAQAENQEESARERARRLREEAIDARKAAQDANRRDSSAPLDEYGRRPFVASDPTTWSDIIDPKALPEGVDLKDPKTFPILERAYREALEKKFGKRSGTVRNGTNGTSSAKGASSSESSKPASGNLSVILQDAAGAPLKNIDVWAPIIDELSLAGGQVAFSAGDKERKASSNNDGLAFFDTATLGLDTSKKWPALSKVVVQSYAYATIVRELKTIELQHKANTLELTLVPAVMVEVKVVDREGNPIPDASVVVKQGEGRYESLGDAFAASSNIDGRFDLKVARDYRYIFSVSAKGYVPFTTKDFDFRRDERVVSVTLQAGRGVEGYVRNDGAPVEGAKVVSETDGLTTITDANGYFVLAGLKDRISSNRVRVRASKDGHAPTVRDVLVNEQSLELNLPLEGKLSGIVT
ncbi:MAG: carboxypeptidase regulatory-like domain-containing protein, partial [Planctomycetes bacterium]|nr:carboxypeptidase regulatory-like domain-containing protein [Planctomycetota bacterium]